MITPLQHIWNYNTKRYKKKNRRKIMGNEDYNEDRLPPTIPPPDWIYNGGLHVF